ncbi:hypothetical protein V1506DRAFT_509754 [Lipomyces tetrasporus]
MAQNCSPNQDDAASGSLAIQSHTRQTSETEMENTTAEAHSGTAEISKDDYISIRRIGFAFNPTWNVLICNRCHYIVDKSMITSHLTNVHKLKIADESAMQAPSRNCKQYAAESRDIFILGSSAGGVHVATWLFGGDHLPKDNNLLQKSSGPLLSGIVFLGTPFEWDMEGPLKNILIKYYGGEVEVGQLEPRSLMKRTVGHQRTELGAQMRQILVIISEFDPEPIETAGRDFVVALCEDGGNASLMVLDGHNHFSPPFALGTRIPKEEEWGMRVGKWMIDRM